MKYSSFQKGFQSQLHIGCSRTLRSLCSWERVSCRVTQRGGPLSPCVTFCAGSPELLWGAPPFPLLDPSWRELRCRPPSTEHPKMSLASGEAPAKWTLIFLWTRETKIIRKNEMAGSMAFGLSLTGPFKVLKSIKSHSKAPSERIWNQHLSFKG